MATRMPPSRRSPAAAAKATKTAAAPADKPAKPAKRTAAKAAPAAEEAPRKSPSKPTAARVAAAKSTLTKRGRPPKRVFINVLVRETTRAALTRMKVAGKLASQGEVIDQLVMQMLGKGGH